MGNPNPKVSEKFLKLTRPIAPIPGNEPLAAKPVAVRIGVSVYDSVNRLSKADRVGWLRRVITEAAQRELMTDVTDVADVGNDADTKPVMEATVPSVPKRGRKTKGEIHE